MSDPSSEASTAKISNEEAKQRLLNGESLQGVHIERLAFSRKDFDKAINLTECRIDYLDLNHSVFHADVMIRRCKIRTLILSGCTFERKCDFKKTTVGRARVQEAFFKEGATFAEATIGGSFHKSKFQGKAAFGWATFTGDATFTETNFVGDVDFRNSVIRGNCIFEGAECTGTGLFTDLVVEGENRFRNVQWNGDFAWNRSQVKLGMDLSGATLQGVCDFRDMTVGRTISLNRVHLGPAQGFRFMGLVAAAVDMKREQMQGHVYPEGKAMFRAAADEYGFLRLMFQRIHRYEDEDWAYYQFKKMERKAKPLGWNPVNWVIRVCNYLFLDLGCGYGTKPFRTLVACGLMVLVFAMLYFFGIDRRMEIKDYGMGPFNKCWQAFDYSLTAFSGSYSSLELDGGWRILGMFEYLLGVVFLGLFVVALSRKVIR